MNKLGKNTRPIGVKIYEARRAANLSQRRLSDETGISVHRISSIENGSRGDIDVLKRLCKALGVEVGDGE
jgi:transcriptional regulator with XRE-family HTH domain